ncbi:hypothetical protein Tco_0385805 [Tanacetum coccineum]
MATSSSSIASKLKSPTSSTSPSTNGYLNSPLSPPLRVPPPPPTQESEPMEITLTLLPITPPPSILYHLHHISLVITFHGTFLKHMEIHAYFFENSLMVQEASGICGLLESSGSDGGLELIQEEDTQPSKNTSKIHNEVAPIEVEPQNVEVPIRRSARIPQEPGRYVFYVDSEEYELGDLNEPPNYKVALSDLEFDKWLEAMNTEMQSMKDNQVWLLVDLPPNGRTIGSKWLFKKNTKWMAMYTPLNLVWNTKDMVLVYGAKPEAKLKVSCYADASFQTDKDDTKSQTGYVFVLNGGAVDWKSAKQNTTAMSSTEAEYIADAEASMEAVWMRKFIDGLGGVVPSNKRPMEMLCDNEPTIAIANDPRILKGARHF